MHDEFKYCDGCLFCDDHKCDTCPFNWRAKKDKLKFEAANAALVTIILILFVLIILISIYVLLRY